MSTPGQPATPHCIHAVGVGRTGAAYIEALFRTGEVEDALATPGTTFAALLIDIGDEDIQIPNDYARSLKSRLATRNIPIDRLQYESISLAVPDKARFAQDLDAVREAVKKETGRDPWAGLPKDVALPQAGQHVPRSIAKAIYAMGYHLGERKLDGALQRFAAHVKRAQHPSTVLVAFGLAGGTGSGIALDLARHLSNGKFQREAQVVGVGQLSHSGDGEYYNNLTQYMAIEDVDQTLKSSTTNPFTGGLFVVSSEQSWQRLTAYTSTGLKEVRQRFKQMVTNRFVADSFMRFAASDNCQHLVRAIGRSGGKCTLFDVAKLSHPGVQVLPGEAGSKWDAVLQQWIGFTPKYSGLKDGFKTDYAEVHVHAARDMQIEMIDAAFKEVVAANYLKAGQAGFHSYRNEFFDELTAYGNVILPGASKDDLSAYQESKAGFDKLDASRKALELA
jgi:Tubulin like